VEILKGILVGLLVFILFLLAYCLWGYSESNVIDGGSTIVPSPVAKSKDSVGSGSIPKKKVVHLHRKRQKKVPKKIAGAPQIQKVSRPLPHTPLRGNSLPRIPMKIIENERRAR